MKFFVGDVIRLGSEEDARNRTHPGASKTVGHKRLPGSDPDFPDYSEHNATCINIKDEKVYMKCVCDLTWNFNQNLESENYLYEEFNFE